MEAAAHPWPTLGVLMLRDGLVSKEQLEAILDEQRDSRQQRMSGHRLGEILIDRGLVTPTDVAKLVAEQYELPFTELDTTEIDLRVAHRFTEELARRVGFDFGTEEGAAPSPELTSTPPDSGVEEA